MAAVKDSDSSEKTSGYWIELRTWLLHDPGKVIRYLVLFVCCIIVIVQLYECFSKLNDPPISTHSYYTLNETIEMPAVTICREPPFKNEVLSELSRGTCLHPKYITCWLNYPYEDIELDEFFENSTFDMASTFGQYGLDGLSENVDITSGMHFYLGKCFTIKPKAPLKRVSRNAGYSMILKHHVNTSGDQANKYFETQPGWHIYIHDSKENFSEINMKGSGRVEYVFSEINEEIEIKLQSQIFSNIETKHQSCSKAEGYSDIKCGEICIWEDVTAKSNCKGPWIQDVAHEPCNDYKSMKNLTAEYGKVYNSNEDANCDCIQPCESRIFSTYIQNRKNFHQPEPTTQVWIYYTTKLISMIEERPSYDTTQFIADVGGSLGFLLGLSVLGLIGILENLTLFFCGGVIRKVQMNQEQRKKITNGDEQSQSSDVTVVIAGTSKNMERT